MSQQSHQHQLSGQRRGDQPVLLRFQQPQPQQRGKLCIISVKVTVALAGMVALLLAALFSSCVLGPQLPVSSTSTPTPPPMVMVTITSPLEGSKVPRKVIVQGTAFNIPQDKELWILVQPADAPSLYFPQAGPVQVPSSNGRWTTVAYVGLDNQVGVGFVLVAALADQKGSAAIHANLAQGNFPPLDSMNGISIITQVSVVRT